MSKPTTIYCIVDDTTLTTNLEEVGPWVQDGSVHLVVPLYTLERLHLLKKDASQLGQNARKALKLLDQAADLTHNPITIQSFEDQFTEWPQVEKHYTSAVIQRNEAGDVIDDAIPGTLSNEDQPNVCDTVLNLNDLSLSSGDLKTSPSSTPPLSPAGSEPQSNKTSPDVRCATLTKHEAAPVPPSLKPLINYAVWYSYENKHRTKDANIVLLSNSADAAQIAKDFAISPKTIHQLRVSIAAAGHVANPVQNASSSSTRRKGRANSSKDAEPSTLFRYDDASSDEEEPVFRPRSRDQNQARPVSAGRGAANNNVSSRPRGGHSPSNSVSTPQASKPQIPVDEIDPDSFDRGTFARGSTPLANVGNYITPTNGNSRGGPRNFSTGSPRGGFRGQGYRGRGRGRLFVP